MMKMQNTTYNALNMRGLKELPPPTCRHLKINNWDLQNIQFGVDTFAKCGQICKICTSGWFCSCTVRGFFVYLHYL